MSELKVNKLSPESGTTLTLGDAGDTIVNNGTASGFLPTAGSSGNVLTSDGTNWASTAAAGGGAWNLLQTVNASSSSTVDFETGIDSTYKNYVVTFTSLHPSYNGAFLLVRVKIGGAYITASNYEVLRSAKQAGTSSNYGEDSSGSMDAFWTTNEGTGTTSTGNVSGQVTFHDPSNTTMYKIWQGYQTLIPLNGNWRMEDCGGGITNAGAITGIRLYFHSGTIVSGTLKLYGIS